MKLQLCDEITEIQPSFLSELPKNKKIKIKKNRSKHCSSPLDPQATILEVLASTTRHRQNEGEGK